MDHNKYIPNKPPTYVTEYKDRYVNYPKEAYESPPKRYEHHDDKVDIPSPEPPTTHIWQSLSDSIDLLVNNNYEEHLLKSAKEQVQQRRLDGGLEYAYQHCLDVLNSTEKHHLSKEHACMTELPEETRKVIEEFVHCVEALRQA